MSPEKEKILFETFNQLFQEPDIRNDITKSCMGWGFECQDGWFNIIYDLFTEIAKTNIPVQVVQVKEKYGTLRVYIDGGDDEVYALIEKAEDLSSKTCEVCGQEGKLTGTRWYSTLCEIHGKK